MNQLQRLIRLLMTACLLAVISACNNSNSSNTETTSVTKVPASIQKLTLPSGTLRAWVTVDGGTRIEMTIDSVAGTASATIPGLTRDTHTVLIEYELTDTNGTITLASASQTADLSEGPLTITFTDSDYNTSYDEDNDGLTNVEELAMGKNPWGQPEFSLSCFPLDVTSQIVDISFNYDGDLLLPGYSDNTITIIDSVTCGKTTIATITGQNLVAVVEDKINERIYTGTDNSTGEGNIYEVNPSDGTSSLLATLAGDWITSLVIAPPNYGAYGGQLIAVGANSGSIFAIDQSQASPTPVTIASTYTTAVDLVFDNNGILYTGDYANGKILTIAADGTVTEFATGLSRPSGIEIDNSGSRLIIADSIDDALYSADLSSGVVTKLYNVNFGSSASHGIAYDTNGTLLMLTNNSQIEALKASALQQLNTSCMPLSVASSYGNHAFNSAGTLLIANNAGENILLLDRTSCTSTTLATITGQNPISVVEDISTGLIYAGTRSGEIYEINPSDGAFTQLTSTTGYINAMAIAPSGYGSYGGQLIIGTSNGDISAVDQTTTSPTPSNITNIGNTISDFAFSQAGTLYVVDNNLAKIITVAADGTAADLIVAGLSSPDGIEIDHANSRLFIADSGSGTLFSSTFSGTLTSLRSINFAGGWGTSGLAYDGNGTLLMLLGTVEIVAQPVDLAAFNTSCLPLAVNASYGDMAFNADGNLLIADTSSNNILLLNRTSCTTSTFATIAGQNLVSVVEDTVNNRVYAGSGGAGNLYDIDPGTGTSTLITTLGVEANAMAIAPASYGSYAGQLIIVGSDAGIYAVDQSATSPSAVLIVDIGTYASDLVFSSDGTLYVADFSNGKIVTVAADGTLADFATGLTNPDGLAIDNTGSQLFIADSATNTLSSAAIPSGTVTSLGTATFGGGYYPSGLAFDGYATLLIHTGVSTIEAFGL